VVATLRKMLGTVDMWSAIGPAILRRAMACSSADSMLFPLVLG
jgi:hypothetical protein